MRSWFTYPFCTEQEAMMLVSEYRRRGVKVEKSLNGDYRSWCVRAFLPESARIPRTKSHWQQKFRG
ncbi:hypothetical protein NAK90_005607 [Salmonella enterica]|nr:hypothetical protein [Salmonella enterica subsp. enterica serovar Muenchen]EBU8673093.1 hypothetical protein [Salmonella enterica subsp. enterica serovar Panama]EDW0700663.1 hypothetical protein [Salmonella enterica subsp. enterica]EEE1025791.1 hypothetical protein [Salmonella enterica subsp. enterica serovar Miami]EEP1779634.1 hypothetical protein [Salmonella enterica]EHG9469366.1 hypothetical protein [Salmonella enterica subsp. enterica serovar Newport]